MNEFNPTPAFYQQVYLAVKDAMTEARANSQSELEKLNQELADSAAELLRVISFDNVPPNELFLAIDVVKQALQRHANLKKEAE